MVGGRLSYDAYDRHPILAPKVLTRSLRVAGAPLHTKKPYREADGPTEGMVNMEANRGASPRGLRAVSPVYTLEAAKSALWRGYNLNCY